MDATTIAAFGAGFVALLGAVVSAWQTLKSSRKREEKEAREEQRQRLDDLDAKVTSLLIWRNAARTYIFDILDQWPSRVVKPPQPPRELGLSSNGRDSGDGTRRARKR